MIRYFAAYISMMVVMLGLDLVWLGWIAKGTYQDGIGHLMAQQPRLGPAALFYIMYPAALMYFALLRGGLQNGWSEVLIAGALFGAAAYATYDLSNLATLKDWPVSITIMDICWGCFASTVAVAAGKLCMDRITK